MPASSPRVAVPACHPRAGPRRVAVGSRSTLRVPRRRRLGASRAARDEAGAKARQGGGVGVGRS
eukprot:1916536-Prymnesium_polylepis.2